MDDNLFECPNCGAKIYPEMTRCPECGQMMYPEDEVPSKADLAEKQPRWVSILGAVAIGLMISCGIASLIHFILTVFISSEKLDLAGEAVLFLAGPIGALVGSYVAGGIARQQAKWIGVVVSALMLPFLGLFSTHWVEVNLEFLISPWVVTAGLVTILAGFMGGWLNYKLTQDIGWKEKWQVRGWEDLLYQDLLRKVRFNGSTADRLIEYERKQEPQASRLQLIQKAIERWERDNR